VLEDMDSNNTTWVNGETTKRSSLKNGDKLKIGETEMVIDFD
jgi:pSer/pThr/pTyr-binding forkhead associated (FHA) protein